MDDARYRRLLDETAGMEGAALSPQDEALYRLVFEALEEPPPLPAPGALARVVEARVEEMESARLAAAEWVALAVFAIVVALHLPRLLSPVEAIAHAVGSAGAGAGTELLLAAGVAGVLFAVLGRPVRGSVRAWRG